MRRHRVSSVFALTLALAGAASAWQAAPAAQIPPPAPTIIDPCAALDLRTVQVTRVRPVPPFEEKLRTPHQATGETRENLPVVKLRDTIAVTVKDLNKLLTRERCLEKDGAERNIVLYLDRRPLPDVVSRPPSDPAKDVLMFPLNRTEASREVWTYLLGRPRLSDRKVEVSVGVDNQFAVPSTAQVYLRVIPRGWFSFWVAIFGIFAVGFVLLARRSDLLRDPVTAPATARPPYSLARTQAAWWFFLALASYLLIGMVTGDFSTSITGTTLVLLGISAGTAAGSAFIDASKTSRVSQAQDSARATAMYAEIQSLNTDVKQLQSAMQTSGDPALAQKMADMEAMRIEKLSVYRKLTNQSESFLLDVLSDSSGVNFHRFQALAWTVVLGLIFVGHVYRDLAMPQFSETLLGLMGISSGTYLSLKIPENPSPDPAPPNPAAPPDPPR
ncbi:MAG TPA: hypothetical protein VNM67_15790 [Thermoanaerobaculia bacterium]|jgi:hypothetical protein|nr:hypothetical protein [Thermoanaerobaculia bacterium]